MKHTHFKPILRRVCALVLTAALLIPTTARAAAPTPVLVNDRTILDGLSYCNTVSVGSAGQVESYAVELEEHSALRPILLQSAGSIYGGATINKAVELARSMGLQVYAAINTDYFSPTTGVPLGIVIEDGVYKSAPAGAPAMLIDSHGAVSLCAEPKVTMELVNFLTEETVIPDYFNKYRVATGGMYLLNSDFSSVSTRTSTPGWFVRFKQTGPVTQSLGVNSSITLTVTELIRSDEALVIGADEYILTADDNADLSAVFDAFRVGDTFTLRTSCDDPALSAARYAGGVGDTLVYDGKLTDPAQWAHPDKARAPRSALGVKADGTLILYAADGRQSNRSVGLTLSELADEMLSLGCQWAVNLDGGGSTALTVWIPGEAGPAVQSSPSDGRPRSCATYLLIVGDAAGSGLPASLAMENDGLLVLAGSSVPLGSAVAVDDALNPLEVELGELMIYPQSELGTVTGGIYTAGMLPGTEILTVLTEHSDLRGEMRLHVIDSLTELQVHADDSASHLSTLSINPGDSITLSVTGSYYGKTVHFNLHDVSFSVSESLGAVDENGVFTASPTAFESGTLTVTCGGVSRDINVTLQNVHIDVLSDHWAYDAVDFCYRNGIVNGISSTHYGPDSLIRRGDFVLMIYSALGRPMVSEPCTFTDVAADAYYADALAWAQSIGLISGMGDGTFSPNAPITREQAFSVLRRVLSLLDMDCPDANPTVLSRFTDVSRISSYARSNTATLAAQGIVGGDDQGNINPGGNLTRAEMAALVHRTMTHTPVTEAPETQPPTDGTLTLDLDELIVWNGENAVLTAFGGEGTVTWTSSDPSVAVVAPDGTVTNLSASGGTQTVIITATCGSLTASCIVYCPQSQLAGTVHTAGSALNIRSGPGTDYASQGKLANGATVVVLDTSDDWCRILYFDGSEARIGYVSASYLTLTYRW